MVMVHLKYEMQLKEHLNYSTNFLVDSIPSLKLNLNLKYLLILNQYPRIIQETIQNKRKNQLRNNQDLRIIQVLLVTLQLRHLEWIIVKVVYLLIILLQVLNRISLIRFLRLWFSLMTLIGKKENLLLMIYKVF